MDWPDREFDGPDDYSHIDFETWLHEISNITAQNKSKIRQFKTILRQFEKQGANPTVPLDAPNVRNSIKLLSRFDTKFNQTVCRVFEN
jgi:hypothetical protein